MIIPELVDGCQLRCAVCWNRNRTGSFRQMELSTVEKVIEVFGNGRRANYHWYNWGEPLLYKRFHEFADIAKHTRSSISSNFSLPLTDAHFDSMAKLEQITISMSGLTPEVYNVYHQGGNFQLVMSNLMRLLTHSKRPQRIRMNWLRHPHNACQEKMASDFCEKNGIVWGPLNANCEVEEAIEGFTHPFLKTSRQYSSRHLQNCKVQRWIPISVDGEYLLCCTSHNVPIGLTIWDNVTGDDIRETKRRHSLCKACTEKEYWRMF